jgi:XTP/dITP diphosphohydrolase
MAGSNGLARLVVSTRNEHKLRELAEILHGAELVPLPSDVVLPPETGTTYTDNALVKARAARAATGEPVIADDSGISVNALGGRPGVHSARFAGPEATDEQNLDLLLTQVAAHDDRSAAYVCVIAHIDDDGNERVFEGRCEGVLIDFVPLDTGPDDERTMAELGPDEKHAISHRGRAARALAEALEAGE